MSGGTKNNVLVTRISERSQDTRVILNFFYLKFEERKDKTSTSGVLTRATKGLMSKKNPTLRYYNPKTQNIFCSRLNNVSDLIKQGAPKSGMALITNL